MITKNYIKMCEKAEEIQKAWKPKCGDWFFINDDIKVIDSTGTHFMNKDYDKWLPTQEQLQEMVKDSLFYISGSYKNIHAAASTGKRDGHVVLKKAKSWNELWLAFVMKEKWNKIWNGKDWE